MRIAIVCNDTRGGVQPYVALGIGLQAAGHEVSALAPAGLTDLFTTAGIPAQPLSGNLDEAMGLIAGVAERGTFAAMRLAAREMPERIATWTREALAFCTGADVVTGGVGGMVVALSAAERVGAPFIETHLQPIGLPTDRYPGAMFAGVPDWLGGLGRHTSHFLSEAAIWAPFSGAMQGAREKVLGLQGRPRAAQGQPVIYGFSRHVAPMPSDPRRPRTVTGYWTLAAACDWTPPAALADFIARPGPVVSIGFGSMASQSPETTTALVLAAVRDAGVRAVLLSGWGGFDPQAGNGDVLVAESLPHDWLFPQMAAVVHHGGAGTTGAAIGAGVPQIVVPFAMDQPFWAGRVTALGAGPAAIPRRRLTHESLARALRQTVSDTRMHEAAGTLGSLVRAEDGVAGAVAQFERMRLTKAA